MGVEGGEGKGESREEVDKTISRTSIPVVQRRGEHSQYNVTVLSLT
jgi:hypothetical protein